MLEGVGQGQQGKVLQSVTAVGSSNEVAQSDGIGKGRCNGSLINANMRVKSIQQVLVLDVTPIVVDVSMIGKRLSDTLVEFLKHVSI